MSLAPVRCRVPRRCRAFARSDDAHLDTALVERPPDVPFVLEPVEDAWARPALVIIRADRLADGSACDLLAILGRLLAALKCGSLDRRKRDSPTNVERRFWGSASHFDSPV